MIYGWCIQRCLARWDRLWSEKTLRIYRYCLCGIPPLVPGKRYLAIPVMSFNRIHVYITEGTLNGEFVYICLFFFTNFEVLTTSTHTQLWLWTKASIHQIQDVIDLSCWNRSVLPPYSCIGFKFSVGCVQSSQEFASWTKFMRTVLLAEFSPNECVIYTWSWQIDLIQPHCTVELS